MGAGRHDRRELLFVDLPGYGYAKVSKEEREKWLPFVDQYLSERGVAQGAGGAVDARRDPRREDPGLDETEIARYVAARGVSVIAVMTKADKLKKHERKPALEKLRRALGLPVIAVSATDGDGVDELWRRIADATADRMRRVSGERGRRPATRGGLRVVIAALAVNVAIAIFKFIAAGLSRLERRCSPRRATRLADTANQIFLLIGMRKSARPPDRDHPFGYGPETYFWAFMVALCIFSVGGGFSVHEGVEKIVHRHDPHAGAVAIRAGPTSCSACRSSSRATRSPWR